MSEDIYAKPDLTKKVRFQAEREKEDAGTDIYVNTENVTVYDNVWVEGSTPPPTGLQEDTTDQQQQVSPTAASVTVHSQRKNLIRCAAVSLVLLCLLLLAAVILSLVLSMQHRREWITAMNRLWGDNANLTSERDELQSLGHNMSQRMKHLESNNGLLSDHINNITAQRDKLKELIDARCPDNWIKFGISCYLFSTSTKSWSKSREDCQSHGADLVIISDLEEQRFINMFRRRSWIGLTDQDQEKVWRWVNGSKTTTKFWGREQPDNHLNSEDCAEIVFMETDYSWNDKHCNTRTHYVCEKTLNLN